MQDQVAKYVRGYIMYCTSKPINKKLGLYMPLSISNRPWESISMDFVGDLHMSKRGYDYLFLVVDIFSKMCIFIHARRLLLIKKLHFFSFLMFRFILIYLIPLFSIEILGFWVDFKLVCKIRRT